MRCQQCSAENPEEAKFCSECASPMAAKCPRCGASNKPGAKFCNECAAPLAATSPKSITHPATTPSVQVLADVAVASAADGERKTVTALFADIKGSTELEQDLDPEEARAIVDPALKLMIDAVRRYDGYVVQSTGDGIFAIFGAPVAHEDHPQRALYAAMRMQEDLRRYSDKLLADGRAPLEARVGVNTGEVVVRSISTGGGHVEYTPIGHTTNLASRMQAVAPTGSIAITENTRRLVEGYFALKPRGPTRVKGVSEPVNVYEVTGLGPLRTRLQRSASRGYSKFVGREREMDAMRAAAERASAGHGQIVAAMAEAGTGKSRLLFEFKAISHSDWMVLETFSVSHGKASAYLPVIELLYGYFRIAIEDDARRRREKITGRVLALERSLEDALPYLFALLGIVDGEDPLAGMDGQVRKRRTLDAIKRLLLRESLNQPLMVIFEDLHWIDDETQALLNLLADSIGTAKILLLLNYRPEYSHQWNSKTYYTQLRLDPLGKESADEMLSALLGDGAELGALKRMIIEKTEGNPFFMEETVQVLLDEGALVRAGNAVRLTRPLSELKIPPTVQAILAARIDRLPADEKDLLQTLAVLGKEFSLALVWAITGRSDDDLNRILNDLQIGEFIYEQPAMGDVEYTFKHALTQEVAYNSLLIERRKALHERTAAALEALYYDRLDDRLSAVAHHYSRSHNTRKAVHYLRLAGEQALGQAAYVGAEARLRRALELLASVTPDESRDREELLLQLALGRTALVLKPWSSEELAETSRRALELAQALDAKDAMVEALEALRRHEINRGHLGKAHGLAARILALAEQTGDPEHLAIGSKGLAHVLMFQGEFVKARDRAERVMEVPDSVRTENYRRPAMYFLARVLWFLGFPDQAMRRADEIITLPCLDDPVRSNSDLLFSADVYIYCSSSDPIRERLMRLDESRKRLGVQIVLGREKVLRGWLAINDGHFAEGVQLVGEAIEMNRPDPLFEPFHFALMARGLARAGRFDEALSALDRVLRSLEVSEFKMFESVLHCSRGEVLAMAGRDYEESASCFRHSIKIAQNQQARSVELRATVSLARLLAKQNKRDEAREMLADIYNWFTEGFDTADLKDAKALLAELGE